MIKKILGIISIISLTQISIFNSTIIKNYINDYDNIIFNENRLKFGIETKTRIETKFNNQLEYIIKMQLYISLFASSQYFLMYLPGKYYSGPKPLDKRQITPIYKENGVKAFIITTIITQLLCQYDLLDYEFIYNNIDILWLSLNFYALLLCLVLFKLSKIKGFNDYSSNIERFYLGQELYPLINKLNVKFFTNCRIGMMLWPTLLIIYINTQYKLQRKINMSMISNFIVQIIYIFKFFYWEKGYMNSLDIMHDKAGYYICWGCIVWVPSFYTLSGYYLVNNRGTNDDISIFLLIIGISGIILNYWADYQKLMFREKKGQCKIFLKDPKFIIGEYIYEDKYCYSLLLTSGFWGISRHFNYLAELISAYAWCLNCNSIFGLMYPIFLTVLLVHRSKRDYEKCKMKYLNWSSYCDKVQYNIIPLIY